MSRIKACFEGLKAKGQAAFVPFIMAGDPDSATTQALLEGLPAAGADLIELGMPFTDPMADGPAIQLAGQRALQAGMTVVKVLELVAQFRQADTKTPIILMGYYNPIYAYGVDQFLEKASAVGVDGLIVVDLPAEEDAELCLPAQQKGLDFIRLTTPTTDAERAPTVLNNASGFVYYVSITGITGAATAEADKVAPAVKALGEASGLPVCVGFGVRTPERAAEIAAVADGVVVGSAIVSVLNKTQSVPETLDFVQSLSAAVQSVKKK